VDLPVVLIAHLVRELKTIINIVAQTLVSMESFKMTEHAKHAQAANIMTHHQINVCHRSVKSDIKSHYKDNWKDVQTTL
jgi:hypothetical protein